MDSYMFSTNLLVNVNVPESSAFSLPNGIFPNNPMNSPEQNFELVKSDPLSSSEGSLSSRHENKRDWKRRQISYLLDLDPPSPPLGALPSQPDHVHINTPKNTGGVGLQSPKITSCSECQEVKETISQLRSKLNGYETRIKDLQGNAAFLLNALNLKLAPSSPSIIEEQMHEDSPNWTPWGNVKVEVEIEEIEGIQDSTASLPNYCNGIFQVTGESEPENVLQNPMTDVASEKAVEGSPDYYPLLYFSQQHATVKKRRQPKGSLGKENHMMGPHSCSVCPRRFIKRSDWERHEKRHQNAESRPYPCSICSKGFKTANDCKQHEQCHDTTRPYICRVCFKGFKSVGDRTKHEDLHGNTRPYICNFCSKGFKTQNGCQKHEKRHNMRTNCHFPCQKCSMTFLMELDLQIHEKCHDNPELQGRF